MKAVIVELRGAYAAALSDDGRVRRLKNAGYAVGQEIELKKTKKTGPGRLLRFACAAAAAAAIALPAYACCSPYSYVSLDVNPSIEYTLNRFDRVLSCSAVNGDGAEVLQQLELKWEPIDNAVRLTLDAIAEKGYITGGEPCGILITASSKNEETSARLAETLAETAEQAAAAETFEAEVETEAVGQERVQEAKSLGVTPGKLGLVEKLQESAADETQVDAEEWLDKPVKEIMDQTKKNEASKNALKTDKDNGKNTDAQGASQGQNQNGNSSDNSNGNSSNNPNGNSSDNPNGNSSDNPNGNSSDKSNGKGSGSGSK